MPQLRDELLAVIRGWKLPFQPSDDTPLIASGLLDSLALLNLVLWVEQETGSPVDPTTFELAREWNTVAGIVRFVEARQRGPQGVGPG